MPPASTDEDLMLRYRDRDDVSAFEELYRRHRQPLYAYLLRRCGDAAVADEIYQDVWLGIVKARRRYRPQARFSTFLYSAAHNRLVDHYRRSAARRSSAHDDLGEQSLPNAEPGPEALAERSQADRQLLEALDRLPAEQRDAFLLRHEAGLDLDCIAQVTGVGAETVKSRLRYAVARLKSAMMEPA